MCSYHATCVFQIQSAKIRRLNGSKRIRTHNHLVCKWALSHLTEPAKWLSFLMSTYPFCAIDCMFSSSHVRVPEYIYTLYTTKCQETICSKQARYLKFKWLQQDSNPQPLSSSVNSQPFSQTSQMIELCCEYLIVRSIWLYVLIKSRRHFRVNLHHIVAWMSCPALLKTGVIFEV